MSDIRLNNICDVCGEYVTPRSAAYHHRIGNTVQATHLACGDEANKHTVRCEECQKVVKVGMWPYCPHEKAQPRKGYEPHWDNHITDHPVWISDPGDKRKHLKEQWRNDQLIKVVEAG